MLECEAENIVYMSRWIISENVNTPSIHAGGATELHLKIYSGRKIHKMRRWISDTFKECIYENLNKFTEGTST